MFTIKQTPEFEQWISGLKDGMARIRLAKRLDKAQRGNLGGGDKSTQQADIKQAIALAKTMQE